MSYPDFDLPVCKDGYSWWYIDAISDDGKNAITIIVFVGSVFSPYYAWSRNKRPTAAEAHCAINVALYGQVNRWAMTERAANSIERSSNYYRVGPSAIQVDGDELVCSIEEISVPIPTRMVGEIRIKLNNVNNEAHPIDSNQQHFWRAVAPKTRVAVQFEQPSISWTGNAYVDSNYGTEPIESAFVSWNWSRAHLNNGDTVVQYDVQRRDGTEEYKTLCLNQDGSNDLDGLTAQTTLPKTRYWRIARSTRLEPNTSISQFSTLEDTPFYSRNRFCTTIKGHDALCMHESIDFDRFNKRWVQCLLPFRMPRKVSASKLIKPRETNATIE